MNLYARPLWSFPYTPTAQLCLLIMLLAGIPFCLGCTSLANQVTKLPDKYLMKRDQLVVHSEFPLASDHRLVSDLVLRRRDLANLLGIEPTDEPIHVFLFENEAMFRKFMATNHADFPFRRALFVKNDTQLKVYASWHAKVGEDLRHEVTHGYLHSTVPDISLWLDEGLAEFFESPRGQAGINSAHVHYLNARLETGTWSPDLERLESLTSASQLTQEDYAESWLWTHFLLSHASARPYGILQSHLQQLKKFGSAFKISQALRQKIESLEPALIEHLKHLKTIQPPATESWR